MTNQPIKQMTPNRAAHLEVSGTRIQTHGAGNHHIAQGFQDLGGNPMNEASPETIVYTFPDILAPIGHHVRLGGRDLLILEIHHGKDGSVKHLCLPVEEES